MRAAIVQMSGGHPECGEFAEPIVTEGRELVDLVASGIHPVVRSLATGRHYGSTGSWPLIPGVDAVARTADGSLIYTGFVEAPYGTLAERMAVPAALRLTLPPGADPVAVAGGVNPGLASWLPLRARLEQRPALGTVLVLGATGVAGQLAVQNAFLCGATRVIAAGRNPAALERVAAAGAVPVPLAGDRAQDIAALSAAFGGQPPELILDFTWGLPAEATFAALQRHGLEEDTADIAYVEIGAMAGPEAALPAALLRSRRIRISGSGAGSSSLANLAAQVPGYLQLIADGRIAPPTRVFPLSQISAAWDAASTSGTRVVVVPS
ncbi:MAG: zinc-binding alcohol dehydrogenase family protein [Candidatus Dormibacteria bacterium]